MPVINRIAAFADDMASWRRHLHAHPEINFDCHKTAAFIVDRLQDFGISDIHQGIAKTGVIALIEGQGDGPTIGLRADMDALPMDETTGLDHRSQNPGAMHACGHDGHVTMLLGAARYLAETRNFKGRVALIFQPAEELGGGAGVMVDEGVLSRFDISQIYALHALPGLPIGQFSTRPGPIMAAVDTATLVVNGRGGHGATPHDTADPLIAAVHLVQAIQTIVSRNHDPMKELVVSVTQIHAGSADNVIPDQAWIQATIRTFDPDVRAMVQRRLSELADGVAAGFGVAVDVTYDIGYPVTVNDRAQTDFAVNIACDVAGPDAVTADMPAQMGAEDFAYFLERTPGAYLFIGNGESAALHNPNFDFNDTSAPYGASFFAKLVETAQPA